MELNGATRLEINSISESLYTFEDKNQTMKILDLLNQKYAKILVAEEKEDAMLALSKTAVEAMRAIIYLFSICFSLVVTQMVCKKSFMREKTNLGIYKALGYTVTNLRMQFAIRFFIVA